jgi:hypothetical protein
MTNAVVIARPAEWTFIVFLPRELLVVRKVEDG